MPVIFYPQPTMSRNAFIGVCYMIGLLIGSFLGGIMADKIGRRKTLFIGIIISGAFSLASLFVKQVGSLVTKIISQYQASYEI